MSEKARPAGPVAGLAASFRFLTVLPVPGAGRGEGLPWAPAWFPVVGLAVGAPVALVLASPLPVLPRAALALALWIVITGALHEDGWMDTLDAAFLSGSPEGRREILKDPRVGAYGVTGSGLSLLLRFGALTVVAPAAVLVASVVGRWFMALSLAMARPGSASGLGRRFTSHGRPFWASLAALGCLFLVSGWIPLPGMAMAVLLAGAVALPWALFLSRRFSGLTGDGHGAVGHLAEVAALLAFVPLAGAPAG